MIKIEQIVKPFNSGFSAVSIKYLLEDLQKRYLVNIEPNIAIVDAVKEKDNYFILVKIPSESNTEYKSDQIFYDVIIELLPPNNSYLSNESVRDYDVRVYSNCPSFTYTFTYVYYKKDACEHPSQQVFYEGWIRRLNGIAEKVGSQLRYPIKFDIMKRTFLLILGLVTLSLTMQSFISAPQEDGDGELSPLVGCWNYIWNDDVHQFYIWCGERNDSLLFTVGGVFFRGDRIHMPEWDEAGKYLQMVRVKKPEGNVVKSKICEGISDFYGFDSWDKYNDVTFELLSDTVMRFILDDDKAYWPDTALMILEKRVNVEFSQQEYQNMYKGE